MIRALLTRLRRCDRGATVVELAVILVPLCMLLLGATELGYRAYASTVVQGTLVQAARVATVGGVGDEEIDIYVRDRISSVTKVPPRITRTSYYDYTRIGKPEKILIDTAPLGSYNAGDCYEDANSNGRHDAEGGRAGGGGSEEVVFYTVEIDLPRIVPVDRLMGWTAVEPIKQSTVLRNQPFGKRATYTC